MAQASVVCLRVWGMDPSHLVLRGPTYSPPETIFCWVSEGGAHVLCFELRKDCPNAEVKKRKMSWASSIRSKALFTCGFDLDGFVT